MAANFADLLMEGDTDHRFGGVVGAGRTVYAPYGGGDPYYTGGAASGDSSAYNLISDTDGLYASFHDAVARHGKTGGGGEGTEGAGTAIWWGAAATPQMEVYGGEFDPRTTSVSWFSYVGEGGQYEGGAEYDEEEFSAYSDYDQAEEEQTQTPAGGVMFGPATVPAAVPDNTAAAEPATGGDDEELTLTFVPCGCPNAE